MKKKTIKRFTFSVPTGTTKQMVRTFIRATDGTDYPVDREIEVQNYTDKIVEYESNNMTEQDALAKEIPGTLCIHTQDIVTVEDE